MSNISNQPSLQDFNHYQLKWLLRLLQLLTWKRSFSIRKITNLHPICITHHLRSFTLSLAIMDNISQKAASSLPSNNCFDLISYTRFPDAPKRSSSIPALAAVPIISNYSNRLDDELMKPRVVSNHPKAPQGLQSVPGHSALSIARHFQPGGQQKQQRMMHCTFRFIWKVKIKKKPNIPSKGPQLFKSLIKPPPSVVDFVSLVADVAAAPLPVALAIVEPPSAIVPQQYRRKLF